MMLGFGSQLALVDLITSLLVSCQGSTACKPCTIWEYEDGTGSSKCNSCFDADVFFGFMKPEQCLLNWVAVAGVVIALVVVWCLKCYSTCTENRAETNKNKMVICIERGNRPSAGVVPSSVRGLEGEDRGDGGWVVLDFKFRLQRSVVRTVMQYTCPEA